MADDTDDAEKTEDPSQRQLDEALRQGDVVKSQEVNAWFVTAAAGLVLMSFSSSSARQLQELFRTLLANAWQVPSDAFALADLARQIGFRVVAAVAVPFLLLALAAICGNIVQHRLVWSVDLLVPKVSRISPLSGMRRLWSKQALANLLKGLIKLVVVGAVFAALMWPQRLRFAALVAVDPQALLDRVLATALELFGAVVAILAIVAAVDYLFQYQQWYQRHKMSRREIRDELRQSDGDPKIKAKIRQLRAGRAKKRMVAAVPTATVVITNPTHYAVALKYERGMNAPVCVAKGIDSLALKIREIAQEHRVAIVENPPLARTLHATVEIDREIPAEHYKAVAEVIGYVMRLSGGQRR